MKDILKYIGIILAVLIIGGGTFLFSQTAKSAETLKNSGNEAAAATIMNVAVGCELIFLISGIAISCLFLGMAEILDKTNKIENYILPADEKETEVNKSDEHEDLF